MTSLKIFFIIFFSFICISWNNMSDGNTAIANFTKKFNQEILKDYGLKLYGAGAGFPLKIEEIGLCFQASYRQDVSGARKLAVEITHKMIKRMNEDKNLLKFLANHPASLRNVNLTISFREKNARSAASIQSVMVIGVRNNVVYNIENEKKTALDTIHEETFDEAEKIVQQEESKS